MKSLNWDSELAIKSLNIGFIKFNYFMNQNGEIIKEIKDVLKE